MVGLLSPTINVQLSLRACMLPACLPALLEFAQARPTMSCIALVYNWGEPERAPPRALQRLRSLSHNNGNGGISYVLPNAHARGLRGAFKGQSRQSESHRRGIVALLNRLNIGRCVQCDEELRIEHGTL